jgi:glycerate 2-kinase
MHPTQAIRAILDAALDAADPGAAVRRSLRLEGELLHVAGAPPFDTRHGRVWLLAAGKASIGMAAAALESLGPRVAGGCVVTSHGQARPLPGVEVWEAAHPLPDAHGTAATAEALRVARRAGADDLVLCLLSGGASALWAAPPPGVTLHALRRTFDALLRSGASIQEMNVVRRRLSHLAGGGLLEAARPARVATLALSDVMGSDPAAIGSGPTVPDRSGFADALEALHRREAEVPPAVRAYLQAGAAAERRAPPVPRASAPDPRVGYHVVADLRTALDAAAARATRLGYRASVVSAALRGEAREAGVMVAEHALRAADAAGRGDARVALLWGGETTVTVRGGGRGGRCQELALAAAVRLDALPGITLAAFGTDGIDGPTDAAGAVVDGQTLQRAIASGLDPAARLADNDAYPVLRAAGALLHTGPTGTNVNDLVVALVDARG